MTRPSRPLIVRVRNWVGDVTLAVPMLQRLADAGFDLQLLGKGWARDLLAGHGWPVHVLPATTRERVALLRQVKREAQAQGATSVQALCLPDSFSSALEFRLAGLPALGHAWEGRRLLLARAVPRPAARGGIDGSVRSIAWHTFDGWPETRTPAPGEGASQGQRTCTKPGANRRTSLFESF